MSEEERKSLVFRVTRTMGEQFQSTGEPLKVACCQLAAGHKDAAVQTLVVSGEYFLAFILCRMFQIMPPNALFEAASEMSIELNSMNIALELAKRVRGDATSSLALEKVCARCQAGEKEAFYAKAGLRPPPSFGDAGASALGEGNMAEAVRCFILAGDVSRASDAAAAALHPIVGSEAWNHGSARTIIRHLGCLPIDSVAPELRSTLLAYAAFFGLIEGMWRGYTVILGGLKRAIDQNAPSVPASQREQLLALTERLKPMHFGNTSTVEMNATGSLLPSAAHKPGIVSAVSGQHLTGTAVRLEDMNSHITRSEAIMWRTVNPFSPLGSGKLLLFV